VAQKRPPWALLKLILGHICLHGSMAGMRMAAPLWALQQGNSAFSVGVLLALFSLTQVFLSIPAGQFADKHGLGKPLGIGILIAMAGALLAALFPHFEVLCFSALCMGGATGIASIALQRHVGRAARDVTELKRVFSWLSIGPAVSNFLGPISAGLMIDYAGPMFGGAAGDQTGFRAAFLLMAALPIVTWLWIRGTTELGPVQQPADSKAPAFWHLLRDVRMRKLLMVNWVLSSCWDVHTFVVPVVGHGLAFSASVIGTILGSFAVAASVIRVLMPWIAAHLREWMVISGAMVVTAFIFAIYPAMESPWTMGICSVVLGAALGSVQPMVMSTLHQITPPAQQGQALGLRLVIINLSSVLMPMLFGTAGLVVGVPVIFWTVGAMVAAGAPVAWKLRPPTEIPHGNATQAGDKNP
jgi:MFS family permease